MTQTVMAATQANGAPDAQPPWLEVTRHDGVAPLGTQPLDQDQKFLPDGLHDHLFGTPPPADAAPRPKTRCYAILDAARLSILPELLEASGLPHKCFFTGEAKDDLGDAAPWLVELQANHPFLRALMSAEEEVPGGLWDIEPGIYLTTTLGFDAVWSHCRKFTRLQNDKGDWMFFRYWSPSVSTRMMSMGNRPELIQLVSPLFPAAPGDIAITVLGKDLCATLKRIPGTQPPAARPVITQPVQDTMRQIRRVQQFEEIIDATLPHVEKDAGSTAVDIRAMLRLKRDLFFQIGFWRRDHLAMLCAWEALLGPNFIEEYANGEISAMLKTSDAAHVAIQRIERFLDAQEDARKEAEAQMQGPEGT